MRMIIRDSYVRWRIHPLIATIAGAILCGALWYAIIYMVMAAWPGR